MPFKKTYYSSNDITTTLDADLDWIKQTGAEFELSVFESDVEMAKDKILMAGHTLNLDIAVSAPDPLLNERRFVFTGTRKNS